jgi:ADP-ribose pyrophosphatase YjhB (NUDIX family)
MVQHCSRGKAFWVLPGGGVDEGESPSEAVIRELREECHVDGTIIRLIDIKDHSRVEHIEEDRFYTFLVDIGEQTPSMGTDPEFEGADQPLTAVRWVTLADIPERDRAFLWASGLLDIKVFYDEVIGWGDNISCPNRLD